MELLPAAKVQQRRWLVRIDPEIFRDERFCKLSVVTRYAYIDSLFFLAANGGPDGTYPLAQFVTEMETDADRVCAQLLNFGIWSLAPGGFTVRPYNGCRIAPEQRAAIPQALRLAVFERDGNHCVECGAIENLSLDHIHPWSLGGPDTYENLRVLCRSCNSSKGAKVPTVPRRSVAEILSEMETGLGGAPKRRPHQDPVFLPGTRLEQL